MAQKPLMLKDYLELDSWSDSFWWAPLQRAGGTTVRSLLETELGRCGPDKTNWKLIRSRSKGALAKVSAVFKLGVPPRLRSRSLSKKLSRSLSIKRGHAKGDGNVIAKESVERGSLFYHSPVVSRCSSSSEVLSSAASSRTEKGILVGGGEGEECIGNQKAEETCGKVDMDCPFEEEKEQLSPVSVLDFLYRDEDEDETVVEQPSANSISFEQNIINIERSKNQLLQKIRRFESLADLNPVHLDHHFACTKTHAQQTNNEQQSQNESPRRLNASALLTQLTGLVSLPIYAEKLLFDFFFEGGASDKELLRQATGWAAAAAGGGVAAEQLGEAAVREVERSGGEWKRFGEEEESVVVEMTGGVVTWLMEELVDDLLVSVG